MLTTLLHDHLNARFMLGSSVIEPSLWLYSVYSADTFTRDFCLLVSENGYKQAMVEDLSLILFVTAQGTLHMCNNCYGWLVVACPS